MLDAPLLAPKYFDTSCGLIEWYGKESVRIFSRLAKMSRDHERTGPHVREIASTTASAPRR
jgi:hypothetical protein